MDESALVELITAAILDGMTVSFSPEDTDGTSMATGIVVDVVHRGPAGCHRDTRTVSLGELSLSGAPSTLLRGVLEDAVEAVVDDAVRAEDRLAPSADAAPLGPTLPYRAPSPAPDPAPRRLPPPMELPPLDPAGTAATGLTITGDPTSTWTWS